MSDWDRTKSAPRPGDRDVALSFVAFVSLPLLWFVAFVVAEFALEKYSMDRSLRMSPLDLALGGVALAVAIAPCVAGIAFGARALVRRRFVAVPLVAMHTAIIAIIVWLVLGA